MNKAYKDYLYKGWWIVASEYYDDWRIFISTGNYETDEEFKNNEDIFFNTLKECKEWINKSEEAKKLKEKYLKNI